MDNRLVQIDASQIAKLKRDLDAMDKGLTRALRRRIRAAGQIGVDAVKASLALPTPDGNTGGEARQKMADATTISVMFGERRAGVAIKTSGRLLGDEHRPILASYNLKRFRHPIYGSDRWVEQQGRPFFGAEISKALRGPALKEIQAAFEDAAKALGAR